MFFNPRQIAASHSFLIAVFAANIAHPAIVRAQGENITMEARPAKSAPTMRGHVAINGLNYYYELHGRGEPLLLLHGGLGSIDMFGPVLPMLAETRQVIG